MNNQNLFFAIVGPSGVGKNTIIDGVNAKLKEAGLLTLDLLTTATTRAKREGEIENVHHFFLTPEEFKRRQESGDFLEVSHPHGRSYGTLKDTFHVQLSQTPLVKDIDATGAMSIKQNLPSICRTILLMPPSINALTERLEGRGADANRLDAALSVGPDLQACLQGNTDKPFTSEDLKGSHLGNYNILLWNVCVEKTIDDFYNYVCKELGY